MFTDINVFLKADWIAYCNRNRSLAKLRDDIMSDQLKLYTDIDQIKICAD